MAYQVIINAHSVQWIILFSIDLVIVSNSHVPMHHFTRIFMHPKPSIQTVTNHQLAIKSIWAKHESFVSYREWIQNVLHFGIEFQLQQLLRSFCIVQNPCWRHAFTHKPKKYQRIKDAYIIGMWQNWYSKQSQCNCFALIQILITSINGNFPI